MSAAGACGREHASRYWRLIVNSSAQRSPMLRIVLATLCPAPDSCELRDCGQVLSRVEDRRSRRRRRSRQVLPAPDTAERESSSRTCVTPALVNAIRLGGPGLAFAPSRPAFGPAGAGVLAGSAGEAAASAARAARPGRLEGWTDSPHEGQIAHWPNKGRSPRPEPTVLQTAHIHRGREAATNSLCPTIYLGVPVSSSAQTALPAVVGRTPHLAARASISTNPNGSGQS